MPPIGPFAVSISRVKSEFALDWEAARNVPWGVLLLFGGGLALAGGFSATGLVEWIGNAVTGFEISTLLLVLVVMVAIVYLTEITSNTASTTTFLPILAAGAVELSLNPMVMTTSVALGASMTFMMLVATPPNAIVFSYEGMKLADMFRAGFMLNNLAIAVAFGLFVALGSIVFGFKIWTAPACIGKIWRRQNNGGPKKAAAKQAASDAKSGQLCCWLCPMQRVRRCHDLACAAKVRSDGTHRSTGIAG